MTEKDLKIVCSKIDEEKEFLNTVSQEIWKMPEIQYKEVQAHAILTSALHKCGFKVQKHYFMPTAFRAEYSSILGSGATAAVLLEYDALPEIGHACGHNLISEAGLAAAIAIKAAMEADPKVAGKLVVLGTPAEEGGGGKIRLIELGAFDDVDFAMMVHPAKKDRVSVLPTFLCIVRCYVEFRGKESHASAYPWEGRNALDAAVACYNNLSMLRQQIKPSCRINVIITKGGVAPNIIPGEARMELFVRAPTMRDLKEIQSRVQFCITSAATATGCDSSFTFDESNCYQNLISNKRLANVFGNYAEQLGMDFTVKSEVVVAGSTDMGNVSHVVPSIHPIYEIKTLSANHTKDFAEAAGSVAAQEPTLSAAKAMALTVLKVMRSSEDLKEVKKQFLEDIQNDRQNGKKICK